MTQPAATDNAKADPRRPVLHVFGVFLLLGLTSFGGPIAHLGYFREAFVVRRRWLSEAAYADLVALCQILPGPASSQVGFAIGLRAAGLAGALAAFVGFTLPSALLMIAAAAGLGFLPDTVKAPLFHGLVLVAVPVVAHAVIGMAMRLCTTVITAGIGIAACALLLAFTQPWLQPAIILAGGAAGIVLIQRNASAPTPSPSFQSRRGGIISLMLFACLLFGLPAITALSQTPGLTLADGFYRSGALVFGGGHVILPLLEAETVGRGWLGADVFLAGYGAAQALPGPLTAFAAYLGAAGDTGLPALAASLIALVAIFAPGFLLVLGILPFWSSLSTQPWMASLAAGAGAAVVGVLGAALWQPVITAAILSPADALIAAAGLAALYARAPVWLVVASVAAAGYVSAGQVLAG
jgi:chromate transporter